MRLSTGNRWLRYFHTIRQLKPSQVFWRVWRKLPLIPAPDTDPPPALRRGDLPLPCACGGRTGGSRPAPIAFDELIEVSRVAVEAAGQARG